MALACDSRACPWSGEVFDVDCDEKVLGRVKGSVVFRSDGDGAEVM